MTESKTVRLVIILLGLIALCSLGVVGALALLELQASDSLVAVLAGAGTTALGALASMLVSTRSVDPAPTPQQVIDQPGDSGLTTIELVNILTFVGVLLLMAGIVPK